MSLNRLRTLAAKDHLRDFGTLHAAPEDELGDGTIVLLGPDEPGFWTSISASPEFADGAPDPVDRWSTRVITALAHNIGGVPLFPFGKPARPFIGWALRSNECFVSPAMLLVHYEAGLFVSFRGAILLPERLDLPRRPANPCDTCATRPCLNACPPGALSKEGYDLPACHTFLDQKEGRECMSRGCAVRRSCPLAASYPRIDEQSAYHMKEFHR